MSELCIVPIVNSGNTGGVGIVTRKSMAGVGSSFSSLTTPLTEGSKMDGASVVVSCTVNFLGFCVLMPSVLSILFPLSSSTCVIFELFPGTKEIYNKPTLPTKEAKFEQE